jgi:tetratricopeptide (TPR) repeat protein
MKLNKLILLLISLVIVLTSVAQTKNMYKSVKIDTTRLINQTGLVQIANRIFQKYYSSSSFNEKSYLDRQFSLLQDKNSVPLTVAHNMSSSSVLISGLGNSINIAVTMSAKAADMFPRDTLIVNNFGATLRLMDSIQTSLPVLLYAKSLYPKAPVILTNLANTLFELYDDRSAEDLYKQALEINPDFSLARQGLVSVYLKRKNLGKALEELFKCAKGMYSESMNNVHDNIKNHDKYSPPKSPINEDAGTSANGSNQSNANTPADELRLPGFPDWGNIGELVYDKSIAKNKTKLDELNPTSKIVNKANRLRTMSYEQKVEIGKKLLQPGKILNKKSVFEIEIMEEYFKDRLADADRQYAKADSLESEEIGKSIEKISSEMESRAKSMGADIDAWQQYLIECCKSITALNSKYFNAWKGNARTRHQTYNNLLSTYWAFCEKYLNQAYDLNDFEELNDKRKLFVSTYYGIIYNDYYFRQMTFGLSNIGAMANEIGECPKSPPPPPPIEKPGEEIDFPEKNVPPCPFQQKKLSLGVGMCSAGIDCESVELECGEGLIGGAKWNYKNKELTAIVGIGAKADFGAGSASVSLEAKSTVGVTFNSKNQIIDIGGSASAGVSATLGVIQANQAVGIDITAVSGINTSRTGELSYSIF